MTTLINHFLAWFRSILPSWLTASSWRVETVATLIGTPIAMLVFGNIYIGAIAWTALHLLYEIFIDANGWDFDDWAIRVEGTILIILLIAKI